MESLVVRAIVVLIMIVVGRVKVVAESVLLPKVFLLVALGLGDELMMVF